MKNKLLALLLITSFTSSCSKAQPVQTTMASKEQIAKEIEEEFKIEEPDYNIDNPQQFVKYYLKSKFSLYNETDLNTIAQNNYELAKLDPKNDTVQERAFLLLLAAQDFTKAQEILDLTDSSDKMTFENLFEYSKLVAKEDYKTAESKLGGLMKTQHRLPHLKILKAYYDYNDHKDIQKLEDEILAINSSLTLDGFKYYYIAREYEEQEDYLKAFQLYTKSFSQYGLRTEDVFSRLVYTAKKLENEDKEMFKSNGKYGVGIYLVDQAFIDINNLKPISNNLKDVTAQVLYDLGWSINQTSSNLAGLNFLALSNLVKQDDKNTFQLAKGMYANNWTTTTENLLESIKPNSAYYLSARIVLADALKEEDPIKAINIIQGLKSTSKFNKHYLDSVLGQIYLNEDKFEQAVQSFTSALNNDKSSKIYFSRAVAHERLHNIDESIKDLKVALEKNPNNPIILNYLGYLLVDINNNTDKGIKYIKRSIELDPTNPASLDSLGWAYIKLGKYEKGLDYLEQAYYIDSQDGVITGHLGDAYMYNEREKEAIIYWKKALELEKKDKREIARIKKQLQKYNNK